jgi:cobalamin biosynthesis Mg chelatase CobN
VYARVVEEPAVPGRRIKPRRIAAQLSVAAILGLLGLLASVLLFAHAGRAASFDAVATLTSPASADTGPVTVTAPAETLTETLPGETIQRIVPAETVTIAQTETTTVSETSAVAIVRPGAVAAAGAAAASQEESDTSSTQWGWIAFGILAFAGVVGGVVWWIRRSKGHKAPTSPPPAET